MVCRLWGRTESDTTEATQQQGTRTSLAQTVKASAYNAGYPGLSLGREDPLEKEMAAHSRTLAWKNPMDGEAW